MKNELLSEIATEEKRICPKCLMTLDQSAPFCLRCGAPVGATATLDPLQAIQAEGFVLRQATDQKRPKPIVLIGTWVLFLPFLVGGLAIALQMILNEGGTAAFVFFWFGIALATVGFVALFKVTRNFLKK